MSKDRKYLTDSEVEQLARAAKARGRYGDRDYAMVLMVWRHGLRASEVGLLRWDRTDFNKGEIWVQRVRSGQSCIHPIWPDEMKALLEIFKANKTPYLFASSRGKPISRGSVCCVIRAAGRSAGFTFNVHPRMLRYSCGYHHANRGTGVFQTQNLLGHVNVRNTLRYQNITISDPIENPPKAEAMTADFLTYTWSSQRGVKLCLEPILALNTPGLLEEALTAVDQSCINRRADRE